MRPDKIVVLGISYTVEYKDNPAEVDSQKRSSLWGQVDYWDRSIRVYAKDKDDEDVWGTIFHEVLHIIAEEFNISALRDCTDKKTHEELDLLSLALTDVLFRNGWIKTEGEQ